MKRLHNGSAHSEEPRRPLLDGRPFCCLDRAFLLCNGRFGAGLIPKRSAVAAHQAGSCPPRLRPRSGTRRGLHRGATSSFAFAQIPDLPAQFRASSPFESPVRAISGSILAALCGGPVGRLSERAAKGGRILNENKRPDLAPVEQGECVHERIARPVAPRLNAIMAHHSKQQAMTQTQTLRAAMGGSNATERPRPEPAQATGSRWAGAAFWRGVRRRWRASRRGHRAAPVVPQGKLTLAWHTNIAARWLDPQQHDGTASPDNFLMAMHDGLIKNFRDELYNHPALAERFEFAEDAKSATFWLRAGHEVP